MKLPPRMCVIVLCLLVAPPAGAYSVLSHEEIVDMAWQPQIVPMLKSRFPGISEAQIVHAHAYAYGGSVIQDIGYYPFGSHYFSDLLHYVRTGDFVEALIRDSTTPDEYAFALGALAHYCGDVIGHPYVNRVTAQEYPRLAEKYGKSVTYDEDQTAHLRTEFGFDVVGVANGFYSQTDYRRFIGFQVAKPVLERAFHETYGIKMSDVIKNEDLAIATYRFSVSNLIPRMSKVALASYHGQIEQAHPGFDRDKFIARYNRTEFEKDFGAKYQKPSLGARILGYLIAVTPKFGPLRALRLSVPNADEQTIYLKSMNETVDRFRSLLAQVHAPATALPAVEEGPAAADDPVAERRKPARHDPVEVADKTQQRRVGKHIADKTAEVSATLPDGPASAKPAVDLAKVDAATIRAVTGETRLPTSPDLPDIDLDTGKATAEGEYRLADETYARLLHDLTHQHSPIVAPALRKSILAYYAKDSQRTGPAKPGVQPDVKAKVQADLAAFRSAPVPR